MHRMSSWRAGLLLAAALHVLQHPFDDVHDVAAVHGAEQTLPSAIQREATDKALKWVRQQFESIPREQHQRLKTSCGGQ